MTELIDIVNEDDVVVGCATKEEAHEKQFAHRIGVVFVFYRDQLLIQLRTPEKDGMLDPSAAGHVATGETYEQAAIREMEEEIGVRAPVVFLGTVSAYRERGERAHSRHIYGLFETHIDDMQYAGITLASREVARVIPIKLSDLSEQIRSRRADFSSGLVLVLRLYAKIKGLNLGDIPLEKFGK
jgi:16S rRNA (adenine1518-N6/adenine1519-N6)-dimethyltransferase